MNGYIKAQVNNMVAMLKTFDKACELAAMQDDGITTREEAKQIKKIKAASQQFKKSLENL